MPPIGSHLGNFQAPNLGIFRVPITTQADSVKQGKADQIIRRLEDDANSESAAK